MDASVGPVFWIVAAVTILSAIAVVSLKNIFHCALFLILCLFSVAGIFILLHAEFLAAAQVLIYVGAVAILMIFAIMLTSNLASRTIKQVNRHALPALFACVLFVFVVIGLIYKSNVWNWAKQGLPDDNVLTIGKLLMTKYMLPFEVVSVLLLAALIGAVVLARGERS
ncbi:MAG: NADH-quinone oxidoreductase subunit J [candidate division Zixibacteria bacterium]|jgi:NADH-quinone oxidoreductase subunit J|nr:NADH-quinone oxidoreductase subunit J [candidate division Zixibacteria bacterium]